MDIKELKDLQARKILAVGDYICEKYGFSIPKAVMQNAFHLLYIETEYWWDQHKDDGPADLLKASGAHAEVIAQANRDEARVQRRNRM